MSGQCVVLPPFSQADRKKYFFLTTSLARSCQIIKWCSSYSRPICPLPTLLALQFYIVHCIERRLHPLGQIRASFIICSTPTTPTPFTQTVQHLYQFRMPPEKSITDICHFLYANTILRLEIVRQKIQKFATKQRRSFSHH